jgi:hypothetical protein
MPRFPFAIALAVLLVACPDPDPESPYPALTVTGAVQDVRGGMVDGARVVIWNEFDTASATTADGGTFSLVVDGSDDPSYFTVKHDGYRPREGRLTLTDASHTAGTFAVMSKDEILFASASWDIYMLRVGTPGSLLRLSGAGAGTADNEATPARSTDGLTVRWANTTQKTVEAASWNGSGASTAWTLDSAYSLLGIAWADRGTLVARSRISDGTDDVVIAEDPSGDLFNYSWPGATPDFSPPAFGYIGPQEIDGNMAAISGATGIYTAFPYFGDNFLVPEHIPGTAAGDLHPKWSSFRTDGTLDLAFQRNYAVYTTRVSAQNKQNVWSAPAAIFGGSGVANVNKLAWAPETAGAPDRLLFAIHPLSSGSATYGTGDLVVVSWDHVAEGAATSPQIVYDADGAGNVGPAIDVAWR